MKGNVKQVKAVEELADQDELNKKELFYASVMLIFSSFPRMPIMVNGMKMQALIDTGCELNLLNETLVNKQSLLPTSIKLVSANGSKINAMGILKNAKIKLNNILYIGDFIVTKGITEKCILGFKFLEKYKMKLICNEGIKVITEEPISGGIGIHKIDTGTQVLLQLHNIG